MTKTKVYIHEIASIQREYVYHDVYMYDLILTLVSASLYLLVYQPVLLI